jgi:hypothetical protein
LGYVLWPLLLLDPFMASLIEASAGRYDQSTRYRNVVVVNLRGS